MDDMAANNSTVLDDVFPMGGFGRHLRCISVAACRSAEAGAKKQGLDKEHDVTALMSMICITREGKAEVRTAGAASSATPQKMTLA